MCNGTVPSVAKSSRRVRWACLPDGADRDNYNDGCVSMLSIRDPDAEPSGFIFDGTGEVAYYRVQHGQQFDSLLDFESNPVDGETDDLIKVTGFKVKEDKKWWWLW